LFSFHPRHGEKIWEREHLLSVNVPVKGFTYVVDGAEEGPITCLRSDVQLAVMEKHPLLKRIRGGPRTFTGKDFAKRFPCCKT
jgi:hypothetical protein